MIDNFVSEIILNNFRNYDSKVIKFFGDFNIIIAPNGSGKTNLLEAISLFSDLKGLRKATVEELKNINSSAVINSDMLFSVCLKFNNSDKLILIQKNDKKQLLFNGEALKKSSQLNDLLKITWLTPQMDDFFNTSSSERRKFLDKTASLLFTSHYDNVKKYEFFIRERLKILENQKNDKWLEIVEKKIVELGVSIANVRNETLERLNNIFENYTTEFPTEKITINGVIENMLNENNSLVVERFYRDKLIENRSLDRENKRTNFGIHKSDMVVFNKHKKMNANLCSTGEQKMLLISLIIVRTLFSRQNGLPILLLDEICSHLDEKTRLSLFRELKKIKVQTFLTGLEKSDFLYLSNNFIEL